MQKMTWSFYATFLVAAILLASLILPVVRGESPIDLGLDLAGGVVVTYRPDFSSRLGSTEGLDEAELLALAKETLASRLYRSLDTVPDIVVRGDQRIVVSLPSQGENQRVLELVGETYQLTLRLVLDGDFEPDGEPPDGGERTEYRVYQGRRLHLAEAEFSGDMLDPRYIRVETGGLGDPNELPQAAVTFRFQAPHDEAFARLTGENIGRELAILLDDEVEWAGRIESTIDGEGTLRGGYDLGEATEIARMLRSGALPVSLEVESLSAVGPGLGQEMQDLGMRALMLSLMLLGVMLTIAYAHRGSLVVAGAVSLSCLLFLIVGIVAAFSLTLDLVGIAGLVLSLGMGMDAFILIFESLVAQQALGSSQGDAGSGVRRAARCRTSGRKDWTIGRLYAFAGAGGTLFHANATTLVVISLLLATERLKSFAVFIFVGILASVLTIMITRRVLWWTHGRMAGGFGPDLLAWLRHRNPGVFRLRKVYFALSAVILMVGLVSPAPLELGADFREGTQLIVSALEEGQVAAVLDELGQQFPEIDARWQVLGEPGLDRYLVTLGAALEVDEPHQGKLLTEQLVAMFTTRSVEIESMSSIDGRLSSQRLLGSLHILVGSFFLLAVYFVALQGPIDRALSKRRLRGLAAAAQIRVFTGVLLAVVLDIAVVLAVLAVLEVPINLPVIAGLLTVLGYSVNDSVVLWDHIRRRWIELRGERSPTEVVTLAVDGILSRALLTSLSTLVPAVVILAVGLTPLVDFAWVIIAGVISGTLSSIFVVGSLAVRALERDEELRPVGEPVDTACVRHRHRPQTAVAQDLSP